MLFEPAQRGPAPALPPTSRVVQSLGEGAPQLREARRFRPLDYAGMLAGFLLVLAITVVNSRGRIFWEDETLGWLLLRDPSWHHMIRAWNLGADGGGFSFYLLGRAWFRLFGESALAFRLFSSACFGVAFVATWAALRRFYPVWIVAFATFNSVFFSPPLTMHFIEGRFYGLLVMSTALALWLALVMEDAPDPTPGYFYVAAFLIHGLLTTSHLLGVVFSFFILCATVALDRMRGCRRFGLYLTAAASWLLLIPERTSILAAGRVGKPHFWTKAPTGIELLGAWSGFSAEIRSVLMVLGVLAVITLLRSTGGGRQALRESYHQRRPVYVVTICLLLVPVGFLLEGTVGTWLFTERYLQPVILGMAYVTAELTLIASEFPLLTAVWRRSAIMGTLMSAAATLFFAAGLFVWVFHHVAQYTPEPVDFTGQLTAHLPHDLPVVVEDAFTFTDLLGRQAGSGVPYTFLLDWPYSISPDAPRLEVTQFHLMQNWKLAGYYPDHVQYAEPFLRDHDRFLVVHNGLIDPGPDAPKPETGNPIAERLAANPAYEVRKLFTLDRTDRDNQRDTAWLVCRGSCDSASVPAQPEHCVLSARGTDCCTGPACKLPVAGAPPRFWQVRSWWR